MAQTSKIVLIGFMGSGKSTIAASLAPKLGFDLCEMDTRIVEASGLSSIPAIFQEHGEAYFRALESQVAESLTNIRHVVISTGGGVITNSENMGYLKHEGLVIYLKATFATVCERIGDISTRPLFQDSSRALSLFTERTPIYESFADVTIETDGVSTDGLTGQIVSTLENLR